METEATMVGDRPNHVGEVLEVPPPGDDALADLIAKHCEAEGTDSLKASIQVGHFSLDLFVHTIESRLRRLEMRGQKAQAAEVARLIVLARTLRRKLSYLYNETIRSGA